MIKPRLHLVHDRQIRLANIRTFLAFLRTSISCWGLGLALFHFIDMQFDKKLGAFFIGVGCVTFIWGVGEYYFVQKNYIRDIAKHTD